MKTSAVVSSGCEPLKPRTSSLCRAAEDISIPAQPKPIKQDVKRMSRKGSKKSQSNREVVLSASPPHTASRSIAEQQTLFTTLLMRQQHQQERSQGRVRISKAIKPEVRDFYDNENDPFLMDSITSGLDRSSVCAIATEKVTSPSVMRNKHIKTMTSLGEGIQTTHFSEQQPFQNSSTMVGKKEAEGEVYVGRNTSLMSGSSNRLFKRQQELLHLQTQLDNSKGEAEEARSLKPLLPLNPLIFKTMSNLEESIQRNDTRTSQQTDSATTVLFTKVKQSKKDLHRKDSASLRKDSFSMDPVLKNRHQLQSAGGLTTAAAADADQQSVKTPQQKVCSKNVVSLKKRRNNSTTEMSQVASLLSTTKPKTQLQSRMQIFSSTSMTSTGLGGGIVKQAQILLQSSPQQQFSQLVQKQMPMFDQAPLQPHTSQHPVSAKYSAKNQTPSTSSKGVDISGSLTEVTNFSHAANKAVKTSNKSVKESENIATTPGTTQTTMTSLSKTQSSNQHRQTTMPSSTVVKNSNGGGVSKPDRQSLLIKKNGVEQHHLLSQEVTIQGKKGHHISSHRGGVTTKTTVLGSATNVQQIRQQSFLNDDEVLPQQSKVFPLPQHSKLQQMLIKKEVYSVHQNDGTSVRSGKKQQQQSQQSSRSSLMTQKLTGKELQQYISTATKTTTSGSKLDKRIVPPLPCSDVTVGRLDHLNVSNSARSPNSSTIGMPMSRNFKVNNYQGAGAGAGTVGLDEEGGGPSSHEYATQQDGPHGQNQFAALLTGNLTSRSSATATSGGIGSKKEIKCVITKQTKFNEERLHQRQQQQMIAAAEAVLVQQATTAEQNSTTNLLETQNRHEAPNSGAKKPSKKQSGLQTDGGKSASKISTHGRATKCSSAVYLPKTSTPTQPIFVPMKKEKSQHIYKYQSNHNQQSSQYSAQKGSAPKQPTPKSLSVDKKKEKLQRRLIVQKIKNQLISAFDTQREGGGRPRNDGFRKINSCAASELGGVAGKVQSRHHNILHTQEDQLSSPVLKHPKLLKMNTPSKEPNPHKPQQRVSKLTTISATKSYQTPATYQNTNTNNNPGSRFSLSLQQKSDNKGKQNNGMKGGVGSGIQSAQLLTKQPQTQDLIVQSTENSPLIQVEQKSNFQSQPSAPQEMTSSSNGGSDQSEFREPNRKVILPTSVAKATKEKLTKFDFILQFDQKSAVKAMSRNSGAQEEFRSQRQQRTLPSLALNNDDDIGLVCTPTSVLHGHQVGAQTLLQNNEKRVFSKDRRTHFSDTRSMDLKRSNKPKFMQPYNKETQGLKVTNHMEPLHSPWKTQPVSVLEDSPQQPPDMGCEHDKQVPPSGLYEDLKIKAKIRAQNHRNPQKSTKVAQQLRGGGTTSTQSKVPEKQTLLDTMDQAALTTKMLDVFSPPESAANVSCPSNIKINAFNIPVDSRKRSESPNIQSDEDTITNGAFSDSQFGDIADEENYGIGKVNQERTPIQIELENENKRQEMIILPKQQPQRPRISGKYTSSTNKHEAMLSSKRVPTVRVEIFAQTEAAVASSHGIHLETAKEILSKKGSKCKCQVGGRDDNAGRDKMVCGNYCKHLSGRQQKKIVKKLMLDHFKNTINTAMQRGQKLSLANRHNPFMHSANFGCLGDRKFLISASWWSKWCDYVNYTVDEFGLTFPKESFRDTFLCDTNEEHDDIDNPFQGVETVEVEFEEQQDKVDQILKLSIFEQSSFATLEEAIENDNEESQLFYERPDCIENKDLLEAEVTYLNQVKRTVVEHFDYEVVPHSVWQHLYSWYSADVTICRRLVMDAMGIKASQEGQIAASLQAPAMIGQPMGQQQDQCRHLPQYRVNLELFPPLNSFGATATLDDRQTQYLDRKQNNYLGIYGSGNGDYDSANDPNSGDTTQFLYKKHIEDLSSHTQTNILLSPQGTPEQFEPPESQYRPSDIFRRNERNWVAKQDTSENDSMIMYQSKVASPEEPLRGGGPGGIRNSGPRSRVSRQTVGVIMSSDDSFNV